MLLLGSISYCVPDKEKLAIRRVAHQRQLRWLESIGLTDYIYYRVEQAYTPEFKEDVQTSLNLESIVSEIGIGPAAARNRLLDKLYGSDSDWLVCMDDDRDLYAHYNASQFIKELGYNPALHKLAQEAVLINGVCPARRPFKKANAQFGKIATHWNLTKACLDGCLQICCIPNLVKFGYAPIFFDESLKFEDGEMPEDIKFEIDWLLQKHFISTNMELVVRDLAPEQRNVSTVYTNVEQRNRAEALQVSAVDDYIRQQTRGRITNLKLLNRRKNIFVPQAISRCDCYAPVLSDFGKYYELWQLRK